MLAGPRTTTRRLMVAGGVVAVTAAAALPALAAGGPVPVPVTTSTTVGQRTLVLTDGAGGDLSATTGLTLVPGKASSVVASVKDAAYTTSGFQVTSTMSNLYQSTTPGSYDFTAPKVPSGAVSLSRSAVPVSLADIGAKVTPVFTLTGNLTSALTGGLGLGTLLPTGGLGALTSVTTSVPATLQGVAVTAGTTVDTLLAGLPLSVLGGTEGAYTNPASLGSGDPTGTTSAPTTIPLVSSTQNPLAKLQTTLGGQSLTALTGGATPVLKTDDILGALSAQLGLPLSVLTPKLSQILTALTPTLSSLTGGVLNLDGTYTGANKVTVTPPVGTVAGTFKGLLTVTLVDTP